MTKTNYLGFEIEAYGNVSDAYVRMAAISANEVFKMMKFNGEKPKIDIGQDYVIFAGKKCASLYELDKTPRICLGLKGIKRKKYLRLPLEVAVAAYSAHEAAHHVQKNLNALEFKEIEIENPEEYKEIENHALEIVSNEVSKQVVKNLYGIKI